MEKARNELQNEMTETCNRLNYGKIVEGIGDVFRIYNKNTNHFECNFDFDSKQF